MKNKTIKSQAVEVIHHYIPRERILDLKVKNKWLVAITDTGSFGIRNE